MVSGVLPDEKLRPLLQGQRHLVGPLQRVSVKQSLDKEDRKGPFN